MIRVPRSGTPDHSSQPMEAFMGTNSAPTHNVFTVEDRGEKEDPFWLKIGAAWTHKDGKGFSLALDCLPLNDAEIVIREPIPEGAQGDAAPSEAQAA